MTEQLAFSDLLTETDTLRRAALDHHRGCVQAWFDQLPESDKNRLAEWMAAYEWDTCAALSAAAGDWHSNRRRTNAA
jgi:hypothetical protein